MPNNRLDEEEFNRFLQRQDEQRERLRAERETRVPEPEPDEGRKTAAVAASLLRDGKSITIAAAVLLLELYCPPQLKPKPSDGDIRRKLEKATKSLSRRKLAELIFQRAREGRFDLIDPILETPITRPHNPDRDWLIEPGAFEIIKSEVVRRPASPTVIMPPIQCGDGVDHETAQAGDQTISTGDPVAQAGADCIELLPLGALDPAEAEFVEWMETEKKARGRYPGRSPGKDEQDGYREWAKEHDIRRDEVEKWARHHGLTSPRGAPAKKS